MEGLTIFQLVSRIIYWCSPVVFFVGILLVMYGNYRKIEQTLGKEAGITKRIVPILENNIFTFQEWLLQKHTMVGLICMVAALIIFFLTPMAYSMDHLGQSSAYLRQSTVSQAWHVSAGTLSRQNKYGPL